MLYETALKLPEGVDVREILAKPLKLQPRSTSFQKTIQIIFFETSSKSKFAKLIASLI